MAESTGLIRDKFESAVKCLPTLVSANAISKEKLLYLYALYKQSIKGDCNTAHPAMWDFKGKQKWDAWNKLKGMPISQAMQEYVTTINEIDSAWESVSKAGSWASVSAMVNTDCVLTDSEKTIFDWAKEGNVAQLQMMLGHCLDVNVLDDQGLGLLHWAADRGKTDIIQLLLQHHADINMRDTEGQTALHYACACSHPQVVSLLLQSGIDKSLVDSDRQTAIDYASDGIKQLFV